MSEGEVAQLLWDDYEVHGLVALEMAREWLDGRTVAPPHFEPYDGDRRLVTDHDRELERLVCEYLHRHTPLVEVVAEEHGGRVPERGVCWVLDPLDGTFNYSHGSQDFGVQLALVRDGECVWGGILLPRRGRLFVAGRGRGAWRDGRRIGPPPHRAHNELAMVINTVRPKGDRQQRDQHVRLVLGLMEIALWELRTVRISEAASVDLTAAADGQVDVVVVLNDKPWDILPGALLCREAGYTVFDLEGKPHRLGSKALVVCAPAHAAWLRKRLQNLLEDLPKQPGTNFRSKTGPAI